MAQSLVDLVVGYVKADAELKLAGIPREICKKCAKFVDIDVIEITKDYPQCNYKIPIVFKARQPNETTLYLGCESYEISDESNEIKFNLPYCFINEANEWFRVHGGGGNINGILGAKHLSFIMKLKYVNVAKSWGQSFNDEVTNKLVQMYYSSYESESTPEKPNLKLDFIAQGGSKNDMKYFTAQSYSDMIIVRQEK